MIEAFLIKILWFSKKSVFLLKNNDNERFRIKRKHH